MQHTEFVALTKRLLDHVEGGTTDQLDDVLRVPVDHYRDPERWRREVDEIFRKVPLLYSLSCELTEPGSFLAKTLLDTPIVAVRGDDGRVRAFVNACVHRGATVVTEEEGRAKRLTCPYHAWTFDHRGTLVGIAGRETFGEVDPDLGLTELPCEERAGMVFVSLTPSDEPMAIDDWLAGVDTTVFEPFGMEEWHLFSRRELVGANWKVAYDGYLEGYHFASLHRTTIFTSVMSNVMAYDAYGPHQRIAFARHGIEKLRDVPEEQWGDWDGLSLITVLFPNVSFAFGSEGCLVSQLLPGPTPDRSRTIQSYYRCRPIDTDDERGRAQAESDRYFEVVRDEDYSTGLGIQAGLATDANREFVFGRNEVGPQRFHRALAALLD